MPEEPWRKIRQERLKQREQPAVESRKYFNLQEGEKIVQELRPCRGLLFYFLFQSIIAFAFLGFFLFMWFVPLFLSFISSPGNTGVLIILIITIIIAAAFFLFVFLSAYLRYKQRHYWITNKKVIFKRGFIGYSISSIPLERISDIIVSRSFLESIFGFGSLFIQSLAGQVTYRARGRFGAEASLQGMKNPEEIQELIFKLIKQKRADEHITM